MNYFNCDDLADRLWRKRWNLTFTTIELVGNEHEFGEILVDNKVRLRIWIEDAETIMWILENFMNDVDNYINDAIDRHLKLEM